MRILIRRNTVKAALLIIGCLLLVGCASLSAEHRRNQYIEQHQDSKSDITLNAIAHGYIKMGMTKEDVLASWGNPCGWCYGTTHNSWGDSWEYNVFGAGSYGVGSGTYVYFDRWGRVSGFSSL